MPPVTVLLLVLAARGVVGILTDGGLLLGDQLGDALGAGDVGGARCARRVQRELDSMRRSASSRSGHANQAGSQATIDLAGYALHQPLRSAPYDMYVTGMRVRVPGQTGWVRVERCQFDAHNHSLDTRLLFRDLTVTGHVKLYEDAVRLVPAGACTMTLRLRRAGLGFTAVPALPAVPALSAAPGRHPALPLPVVAMGRRQGLAMAAPAPLEVRTDARFVDPDFVSVYAHGCPSPGVAGPGQPGLPPHIEHRSDDVLDLPEEPSQHLYQDNSTGRALQPHRDRAARAQSRIQDDGDGEVGRADLSGEMEDVFLRGIRTLLARYMERRLQPALRDAVLAGMGYSVSYGR
ncbi:uncharacterized protein LOC117645028 [Thrips palmi]|uniref:Uncharacterized protein LOC117645028 n=1 Tax=Thrips palmi TaxID=161013 RepID=A0A6P8ZML2_THRPL|nr:uncharacterized protein LOC117645028 [Thrips palmi]